MNTQNENIDLESTLIIENFGFGVFRVSPTGLVVFANKIFLNLLGFSSLQEFQTNYYMIESLRKCFLPTRFYSYLKESSHQLMEYQWIKRNGQPLLLREFISPVKKDDSIIYFDCIVEDTTEKSIIDKILKDINSTDNSILKAISDSILVVKENGVIVECKNGFQKLFPTFNSITDKNLFDLLPKETVNLLLPKIKISLETGDEQTLEFETMIGNQIEYIEARTNIRSHDDAVLILRNISKQKVAEFQIQKYADELRSLNKTKDKFLSIIGHDLRTPLNGLLGYAEILSTESDILDKEEIKEYADYIFEIVRSTNNLLTNLLEWSRLQSGKIIFSPQTITFSTLIEKVMRLVQYSCDHKNISLVYEATSPFQIMGDENMLQSVLINLLGNAIKFTNPGGKIRVLLTDYTEYIKISVIDNGVGISEDNLKKLFDTDLTFTTLGTENEKGTGLGLTLCKEFVKMHQGLISAESILGKGTTFSFTLSKEMYK
jgi:signal transduction histidine kinase